MAKKVEESHADIRASAIGETDHNLRNEDMVRISINGHEHLIEVTLFANLLTEYLIEFSDFDSINKTLSKLPRYVYADSKRFYAPENIVTWSTRNNLAHSETKEFVLNQATIGSQLEKHYMHLAGDKESPSFKHLKVSDLSMVPETPPVPIIKEMEEIKAQLSEFKKEMEELREGNEKLKDILFNNVADYGAESTIQLIPINIYLDTNDNNLIYGAYQSVLDFLTEIGFETSVDFKAKKGSWFKRWIAKSIVAMTSEEVTNRLREAEYAVEVNTILKPQSEVEKNQSEALVGILGSLQGIQNAAVRIGSLIVVKVTSPTGEVSVQTRTLSIAELHIINKHPELLHQPQQILAALNSYLHNDSPPLNDGQS